MGDPTALRDEAQRLRAAAAALREHRSDLDGQVPAIQSNYPLPSPTLWQGPHALTFDDRLDRVTSGLTQVGLEVDRYADDCEAAAVSREAEASALEQAVPAG